MLVQVTTMAWHYVTVIRQVLSTCCQDFFMCNRLHELKQQVITETVSSWRMDGGEDYRRTFKGFIIPMSP